MSEDKHNLTFGSLFAGIGGFDLGFERAGMVCKWQVEIDDYCTKVLAKHWPEVKRYGDIKEVHGAHVAHAESGASGNDGENKWVPNTQINTPTNSGVLGGNRKDAEVCPSCLPPVDVICGGFPCQPYSVAGKRRGAEDDRNLWPEFIRVVREVRPRWVVGENVPGIIRMYLDQVLSDLEGEGYTCWTFNIPACAVDAPHRRERIFVISYAESDIWGASRDDRSTTSDGSGEDVADAETIYAQGYNNGQGQGEFRGNSWWAVEPGIRRVAHGVPSRVDRLKSLGNAIVPQIAEWIGRRIVEIEKGERQNDQ